MAICTMRFRISKCEIKMKDDNHIVLNTKKRNALPAIKQGHPEK